jgi:beta-lactamase regulating signal transducer with metallopeptidase domain
MTAQLVFPTILIQAFGWALLHSIWQGFLIFACLRLVLWLWPHASASVKYNLSYLSLTGVFAWFSITLWQQLHAAMKIRQATWAMIETGIRQKHLEIPAIYHSQSTLTHYVPQLEMWFPVLVALYVTGVAVMSIKFVLDLVQLKQIRQKQVLPGDASWEKHLEKLAAQMRIPRKVQLLISTHIQVPVMIGFLKPVILLPIAMFNNLSAEQLEAILLHELAHIKRNDYLLNIFQSIAETILFFNPFTWWISKNIRLEREHCCDDLVIAGQVQPLQYAKALVALEEYRLTVNALAMAAADNKQHLFHRIKRIMEMKTKNINYTQKLLAITIIAVCLVSIAWLNPIQARAKQKVKKDPAPVLTHISRTYLGDTVVPKVKDAKDLDREAADADIAAAAAEAVAAIDWDAVNSEVDKAMADVDWDAISKDVDKAMKEIDWEAINNTVIQTVAATNKNINTNIHTNLNTNVHANIDTNVINESIRLGMESAKLGTLEAMKALNSKELKEAIEQGRKEAAIAMKEAKKEMAVAMAASRQEMGKQREAMVQQREAMVKQREAMAQQRKVMAAAGSDLKYKKMIDQMASDHLIDREKGFSIEKKNGTLYINKVAQSEAVANKYSEYLAGAESIAISGKDDNLTISVEEKD